MHYENMRHYLYTCFPCGAEGDVKLPCVSVYNALDAAVIKQRACSRTVLNTEALTGRRGDVE